MSFATTGSRSTLRRDLGLVGWQIRYEQRSYWRNRSRGLFTFAFPLQDRRGQRQVRERRHDHAVGEDSRTSAATLGLHGRADRLDLAGHGYDRDRHDRRRDPGLGRRPADRGAARPGAHAAARHSRIHVDRDRDGTVHPKGREWPGDHQPDRASDLVHLRDLPDDSLPAPAAGIAGLK
jgi:hypothetical protein